MATPTALDTLRRGVAAGPIAFDTIPADPVAVADADRITPRAVADVVFRYRRNGFALVQFEREPWTEETVERLAAALGLGEPFVPPLYRRGGYASAAVSRISAPPATDTTQAAHPHFETTVGQDLHCDGTLQDIGEVKSAILLCRSQGAEGGTTVVFNAHAAFAELLATDPAAAQALTARGVLVRRATFNGSDEVNHSPVFAVCDGQLVCRYCVDVTDRWDVPEGSDPAAVRRGLDFLDAARREGSPHLRRFDLGAGQAIVMDNTRISHGRDTYRDGPGRRRCLYRSLHLRHPGGDGPADAPPADASAADGLP